jgi:hypothetical protein
MPSREALVLYVLSGGNKYNVYITFAMLMVTMSLK